LNRKILTIVLAVIVVAAGLVTYAITSIQPSTQPAPTEQQQLTTQLTTTTARESTIIRWKITDANKPTYVEGPDNVSTTIPPNTVPSGTTVTIQKLDPPLAPALPGWGQKVISLYNFTIDKPIDGSVAIRISLPNAELAVLGHYVKGSWEILPFTVENNMAVVEVRELSFFSWIDFKVSWLSDKILDFLTLRWAEKKMLPESATVIKIDGSESFELIAGSAQFISDNKWRIFVQNKAPLHLDIYPINGKVVEVKRTSLWASVESKYGMVVAPRDVGEWIVELQPNETVTYEAYFSDSAVAALFGDVIPLGRFSRALWECVLFARNGREMGWGDIKGLLVIPAVAEAVKKIEEIQEMSILDKGRLTFTYQVWPKVTGIACIAFVGYEKGEPATPPSIYIIDLDSGHQTRLPLQDPNLLPFRYHPAWSPDGKKIAFVSGSIKDPKSPSGVYIYEHIFIVGSEGGKPIQLTEGMSKNTNPAWSPDSKKIAFSSSPCLDPGTLERPPEWGTENIYVMNADGSNKTLIIEGGYDPAWSPDGKKIAFVSGERWKYCNIYIANADGSNRTKLVHGCQPSWSPDGKKIAFTEPSSTGFRIGIIDIDGSNLVWLTKPITVELPDGRETFWGDMDPVWSPDGKKIAFTSERDEGHWNIYIMNADGSNQNRLTEDPSIYRNQPTWSPLKIKP
jgi:Tol biopolymer transport system component